LNNNNQTPVAFGSESVLTLLGLKNAIATINLNGKSDGLPKDFDNNKFLVKREETLPSELINFSYDRLNSPTTEVKKSTNTIQSYIQPFVSKNVKWAS
jgi:hypothetical protein